MVEISDNLPTSVAVKVLKEGASRKTREDFQREVDIMAGFDHENILRLLAIVTVGELSRCINNNVDSTNTNMIVSLNLTK